MRIRTGRSLDVPAVLALWRQADSLPSKTDTEAGLSRLLERDPGSLLLAEADAEIVGTLIAGWDGWRGSFYRLAVHPRVRRRGIATALLRTGEQRLHELGAIRLTAIVADDESHAMAFWRAAGYEVQVDQCRFVRIPAEIAEDAPSS